MCDYEMTKKTFQIFCSNSTLCNSTIIITGEIIELYAKKTKLNLVSKISFSF